MYYHPPSKLLHITIQFPKRHRSLFLAHRDRLIDCTHKVLGVPRVDDETGVEGLCGSSELREDHHTVALGLRGDVLVGNEVHAVACTGYEADVRDSVEGDELIEVDGSVHEMDGHEFDCA